MSATNERVPFRLYNMECCNLLLCWVNSRHMTYCPGCGKFVYPACKGWVVSSDDNATLRVKI